MDADNAEQNAGKDAQECLHTIMEYREASTIVSYIGSLVEGQIPRVEAWQHP